MRILLVPAALALLAASAPPAPPASRSAAQRGSALAAQRCAACHAVTANAPAPNPESPTFEEIANRPGLTGRTLRTFLRNSHNFPDAMGFTLSGSQANDLSAYMVTLRRPGYKPAI